MKTIRFGVFETNSSSVHSLAVMKEADYRDWIDGKITISLTTGKPSDKALHPDDDEILTYEEFQDQYDYGTELTSDGDLAGKDVKISHGVAVFIYNFPH